MDSGAACMSMEIWINHTNPEECDCDTVQKIGYQRKCSSEFVCEWGRFDNGEADPTRGLKHLMLTTTDVVARMLEFGPEPGTRGGTVSASQDCERLFAHVDYDGSRTTWELFEAHFWDGHGPDILIGRWPD